MDYRQKDDDGKNQFCHSHHSVKKTAPTDYMLNSHTIGNVEAGAILGQRNCSAIKKTTAMHFTEDTHKYQINLSAN